MKCSRKWNKSGIPHTGWSPIWIQDLGDRVGSCGMCDNRIRWRHHIEHTEYGELGVGWQCASKMTNRDAKLSEKDCKQFWRERERWIENGWRLNDSGNPQKRERPWRQTITLFKDGGRWKFVVNPGGQFSIYSYATDFDARAAAHDWLYAERLRDYTRPQKEATKTAD